MSWRHEACPRNRPSAFTARQESNFHTDRRPIAHSRSNCKPLRAAEQPVHRNRSQSPPHSTFNRWIIGGRRPRSPSYPGRLQAAPNAAMRAKLGFMCAVLLLAAAAMLPQAVQAYEFDMVSGGGCGGGREQRLQRRPCCCSPPLPGTLLLEADPMVNAVSIGQHGPGMASTGQSLPPRKVHVLAASQVFQTKCIMEDVDEGVEVTGDFRAFQRDHPDQEVAIDARVGAARSAGGMPPGRHAELPRTFSAGFSTSLSPLIPCSSTRCSLRTRRGSWCMSGTAQLRASSTLCQAARASTSSASPPKV